MKRALALLALGAALGLALFVHRSALAQVQFPDGYQTAVGLQSASVPGIAIDGGAGAWSVVWDCDFTGLARQALDGGDGTVYTLCSAPCTVIGSGIGGAHLLGYAELDGGLWDIQLDAGGANTAAMWASTASTSNLTGFSCDLTSLVPASFRYTTPLIVDLYVLRGISTTYSLAFDQWAINFALAPRSAAATVWPGITGESLMNTNQFWGAVPSMSNSSVQMDSPSGQALGNAWWDSIRMVAPMGFLGYMVEVEEGKYDGGTLFNDQTQWQHTEAIFNVANTASQFQPWGAGTDVVTQARLRIGVLRDVAAGGTAAVPYIFGRVRVQVFAGE